MSRKTKSNLFVAAMILCLAVSFGTLGWLLLTTFIDGIPGLTGKLFTDPPSTQPEEACGIATAFQCVLTTDSPTSSRIISAMASGS